MGSRLLRFVEHERISFSEEENLANLLLKRLKGTRVGRKTSLEEQTLLGMTYDLSSDMFSMGHYIGADWIDKKEGIGLIVTPKIKNIDFMKMLMRCFENDEINDKFDQLLCIKTESKQIAVSSDDFQIEPILVVYFVNLVAHIVRSGLKNDYHYEVRPLNGKIKGKIQMSSYLSKHYSVGRKDIVVCKYQEYSEDCLDNRILKAALLCCESVIKRNSRTMGSSTMGKITKLLSYSLGGLQKVSSVVSMSELDSVHINPIFKNYKAAIPIAKMIIKKKGYCVNRGDNNLQYFPPFTIDMALLFERYVYSLLKNRYREQIIFQMETYGNILDFCKLDEKLIIDTKYIPKWKSIVNHENVRQLSGYARNIRVRSKLGLPKEDETTILRCLIIYPDNEGFENLDLFSNYLFEDSHVMNIEEYIHFKKIGIKLPMIQS